MNNLWDYWQILYRRKVLCLGYQETIGSQPIGQCTVLSLTKLWAARLGNISTSSLLFQSLDDLIQPRILSLGRCKLNAASGVGACECRRGFAGDECGVCARGFVGYPPKCTPAKACARDCGRGTCDLASGECRCPAQYAGPQCAECAAGFGGPSCVPTARVTDQGWQPTKGDIQRTDSGWQPIGAAARHVTSTSVLPQARAAPPAWRTGFPP